MKQNQDGQHDPIATRKQRYIRGASQGRTTKFLILFAIIGLLVLGLSLVPY
ncbi:hypothetical protein FB480_11558 [Agrobacterium vitis]|nr:hypothetical protein FB480_11558 [Agrobacterium vitis]